MTDRGLRIADCGLRIGEGFGHELCLPRTSLIRNPQSAIRNSARQPAVRP